MDNQNQDQIRLQMSGLMSAMAAIIRANQEDQDLCSKCLDDDLFDVVPALVKLFNR